MHLCVSVERGGRVGGEGGARGCISVRAMRISGKEVTMKTEE